MRETSSPARRQRAVCWAALALIGATGLAGCNSGSSPKDDAANTARAFAAAYLGDRPQRACTLTTGSQQLCTEDAFPSQPRSKSRVAIKLLNSGGGIDSIEVDGDKATASGIAGLNETLELVLEDGQWKVSEIGDGSPSGPLGSG